MTPLGRATFLRLGFVLAVTIVGFVMLQRPAREVETRAAVGVLQLVRAEGITARGTAVIVAPADEQPFRAIVTPSCSSLASILAIGCLASLAPVSGRTRKATALAVAMVTVAVGNVARIAASLGFGLLAGPGTLILFHDSVGNVFSFAYTLLGYVLMLYLLLPASPAADETIAYVGS